MDWAFFWRWVIKLHKVMAKTCWCGFGRYTFLWWTIKSIKRYANIFEWIKRSQIFVKWSRIGLWNWKQTSLKSLKLFSFSLICKIDEALADVGIGSNRLIELSFWRKKLSRQLCIQIIPRLEWPSPKSLMNKR